MTEGREATADCMAVGEGIGGSPLLCDRRKDHDGDHHCPLTGATWGVIEPGRQTTPVDAPEQHDERCEADFITGPMAYSPCACAERAAGREATALDDLSTALDAAKDALRRARLDLAIRRDSMLTYDEQVAALDVYAEFGR